MVTLMSLQKLYNDKRILKDFKMAHQISLLRFKLIVSFIL